jgi:4'-phosphopantetheinyl transferase EntD
MNSTSFAGTILAEDIVPDVLVAHRQIAAGDENHLSAEEQDSFRRCALIVRRRSGAARSAARQLMAIAGCERWSLPRQKDGGPIWPFGFVGSLSHCDYYAAAALAPRSIFAGVGIDIEPTIPLPGDILDTIATPFELAEFDRTSVEGRILFCAKEAAYKAVYPLDKRFLDWHEVNIDFRSRTALTSYGRRVEIAIQIKAAIIAVATIHAQAWSSGTSSWIA